MKRSKSIYLILAAGALFQQAVRSDAATIISPVNTPPPATTPVVDPDSVLLKWAPGTNEVYFRVYAGAPTLKQRAYLSTNEFLLTDLDPATSYQWRIDAYDENRRLVGSRGAVWNFRTAPADPRKTSAPYPASGSTVTNGQDNVLRWSAGSAGGSFNIYFGKDSSPDETEFRGNLTGNPVELSFYPGILEPNKQYYWRVDTVVDLNGTVVPGRVWTFRTAYGTTNFPSTNTILFADDFENGVTNSAPTGWVRLNSSTESGQVAGHPGKAAKLRGNTWIERAVSTRNMKDIQISYHRSLTNYGAGEGFSCQWSTNGADWIVALSESSGDFTDPLTVLSLGPAASRQSSFRIRFVSSAAANDAQACVDNLQVRGVYAPIIPVRDPQHDIRNATVIFLGDSLTSNSGSLREDPDKEHWTDQVAQRFNLNVLTAHAYDPNDNTTRYLTHGKGGSRAYYGAGATLPTYHGDDAADPNLGGYQRLKYAFQEIRQGVPGMVQPEFVVINFGMNDHKRVWKGPVSEGQSSPAAFNQQLKLLVDFVRTNGAIPILVTPHDFYLGTPEDLESYSASYSPELYNNAEDDFSAIGRLHHFLAETRAVAAGSPAEGRAPVDLIEINEPSQDYDANEFTVTGGVHLEGLGHDVYAQVIGDFLSARFGDGSPAAPPPPPAPSCPPPSDPPPTPITGNFVLTASGCWTAGENWNNNQPPSATNIVYIRSGLTASVGYDVGVIRRFYLGDNATTYPSPTGTLNILPRGRLVTSLDVPEVGRGVPGSVGNLNLSGGLLQIGTSSNFVLKVGVDSAGEAVTGNFIISGGEFCGRLLVGSSGVAGAVPDVVRIDGSAATIGSPATGTGLDLRASGTVEYVFDAAGASGMNFPNGAGIFNTNAHIVVDGADYEGGPGTFELLRCSSFTGKPIITLENFPSGASYQWNPTNGVFTVTVEQLELPALEYSVSGGLLELRWPASFLGWYAQSNVLSASTAAAWFDIAGSDSVTNVTVPLDLARTNIFYRLRKP